MVDLMDIELMDDFLIFAGIGYFIFFGDLLISGILFGAGILMKFASGETNSLPKRDKNERYDENKDTGADELDDFDDDGDDGDD